MAVITKKGGSKWSPLVEESDVTLVDYLLMIRRSVVT